MRREIRFTSEVRNAEGGGRVGVLNILDVIGFPFIESRDVATAMGEMGDVDEIEVRINSPGGSVYDGMGIMNLLRQQGVPVTGRVIGAAISAASIVAMGADRLLMEEGTMMMVHNASLLTIGTAEQLRKDADLVGKIDGQLARLYARRTERDASEMQTLMDQETWMTDQEAVEAGFADETVGGGEATVEDIDRSMVLKMGYGKIPTAIGAGDFNNTMKSEVLNMEHVQRESEQNQENQLDSETTVTNEQPSREPVNAESTSSVDAPADPDPVQAERTRCREIRVQAQTFGYEQLGDDLIDRGVSVDAAMNAFRDRRLADLENQAPQHSGENEDPDNTVVSGGSPEDRWKAEYARNAELQNEFGSEDAYLAYRRAEAAGRVRIAGRK